MNMQHCQYPEIISDQQQCEKDFYMYKIQKTCVITKIVCDISKDSCVYRRVL